MAQDETIRLKVEELVHALRKAGLWMKEEPSWVKNYSGRQENLEPDFFQWLQFVYLPNRLMNKESIVSANKPSITLQAKKFAEYGKINDKILRALIELDSL